MHAYLYALGAFLLLVLVCGVVAVARSLWLLRSVRTRVPDAPFGKESGHAFRGPRPAGMLSPSLFRGFLRGGSFRRPFTRDGAKHQLYRLAAWASAAGDDGAAGALDRAALELRDEPRPSTEAASSAPGLPRQADGVPVYAEPGTRLLGFLARYDPKETSFIASGGVLLSAKRGSWVTTDGPEKLAAAFPGVFRAVALALLAFLLPIAAQAVDLPASSLSQAHHPAIRWGAPVCAVGYVESVRHERDGDLHAWLCPSSTRRTMPERRQECVLGEIVPSRPLPRPVRGAHVRMCGLWVESDIQHSWTELHPVTGWEVAP